MELTLSVLLPQTVDLTHLNLTKKEYEWNGKTYPQGLARSEVKKNWIIEETPVADYLLKQLPNDFQLTVLKCLSIQGDGLSEYVHSMINDEIDVIDDQTLFKIFNTTVDLSHIWAVVFEIDDNPIKELFNDTSENLKNKLRERLIGRESFISYKIG